MWVYWHNGGWNQISAFGTRISLRHVFQWTRQRDSSTIPPHPLLLVYRIERIDKQPISNSPSSSIIASIYSQMKLPMKAFGMVIFNQLRSLISRPESGFCICRTITAMGVVAVKRRGTSSTVPKQVKTVFTLTVINVINHVNLSLFHRHLVLLSVSGMLEVIDELVDVSVVTEGGLGGNSPIAAVVCATQAPGSIGRTGSARGMVK